MVTPTGADARDTRAVSFRLAPQGSVPLRTATELERQLRRRLSLVSALVGTSMGAFGVFALIVRRQHIRDQFLSLFTEPPLPGGLLVVSIGMLTMLWMLSRSSAPSIRRLRVFESIGVMLLAMFMLLNQLAAMATMHGVLLD